MSPALLLALAGVSFIDILADYQVSATYIAPLMHRLRKNNPALPAFMGESKPAYLQKMFDHILEKYGSVEAMLMVNGVMVEEIEALRAKLTGR